MLSSTFLAVLCASLVQATTPRPADVPQPATTYCTSTLTVPYPTPCTQLCVSTVTKTIETIRVSCDGCRYLATSTAAPENGVYCSVSTTLAKRGPRDSLTSVNSVRLLRVLCQFPRSGTMSTRLRRPSAMRRRRGLGRDQARSRTCISVSRCSILSSETETYC